MGLPEPIEPTEPKSDPEPPAPAASDDRDWLVGADEGLSAEFQKPSDAARPAPRLSRFAGEEADPRPSRPDLPPPVLHRPGGGAADAQGAAPAAPPGARAGKADAAPPATPTLAWEPGTNSVPSLRRDAERPRAAAPDHARDFPMDDAEERAQAAAQVAADSAAEAEAAAEAAAAAAPRPHEIVAPSEFEVAAPPPPWWSRLGELLREDRRAQAALAIVVLILFAWALWPRGERSTSIGNIRAHAAAFDGRLVRVSGRVVDVFDVGGGWAYDLRQGRDTLVVFSRTRAPRRDEHLVVNGTISTGYLDGEPRLALFESSDSN